MNQSFLYASSIRKDSQLVWYLFEGFAEKTDQFAGMGYRPQQTAEERVMMSASTKVLDSKVALAG